MTQFINQQISTRQLTSELLHLQESAEQSMQSGETTSRELRRFYLGAEGSLTQLGKRIRDIPAQERAQIGKLINEIRQVIEAGIAAKQQTEEAKLASESKLASQRELDLTIPGHVPVQGHLHPTTLVIREMNEIFQSLGFSIADGREIETEEYNFDRTNLPPDHPARDLQDVLYIDAPNYLLRTHTSSMETRILATATPPYRFVMAGFWVSRHLLTFVLSPLSVAKTQNAAKN